MGRYTDRMNIESIRRTTIICEECGQKMYVDDVDYSFDGCYDTYYNCTHCRTSCIKQIRFRQTFRECWHSENDGVRDWEHKFRIKRE